MENNKVGADDALKSNGSTNPWHGAISNSEMLSVLRSSEVAREAEKIRVRDDARALVAAERAGGVRGLPEPLTLSQSLLLPPEYPEQWRIAGMLPRGGNATLTAVRKTGKTVTSANLIRSLVDGDPFLGEFEIIPVTGTVAISNYEVSREQLDRWVGGQGVKHPDRIVQFPFRGYRVPLLTDEGCEWMVDRLRKTDCEVWIVDPFSASFNAAGGMQENDNSEVRRYLERLNEIKREAGVSEIVLTVHGSRGQQEGSERSRAASSLEDWPDALWQLNRGKAEDHTRFFKVAAGRDVTEGEYRLDLNELTGRLTVAGGSRKESRLEPICDDIVDFLAENTNAKRGSIVDEMVRQDHGRNDTRQALDLMVANGNVIEVPGARNAKFYQLPTDESASLPESAATNSATGILEEKASVSVPVCRVNGPADSHSPQTEYQGAEIAPMRYDNSSDRLCEVCGIHSPINDFVSLCSDCNAERVRESIKGDKR